MHKQQDIFKDKKAKIDYKDIDLLSKCLKHNKNFKKMTSAKNQRAIAIALKRARFMGLFPYVVR